MSRAVDRLASETNILSLSADGAAQAAANVAILTNQKPSFMGALLALRAGVSSFLAEGIRQNSSQDLVGPVISRLRAIQKVGFEYGAINANGVPFFGDRVIGNSLIHDKNSGLYPSIISSASLTAKSFSHPVDVGFAASISEAVDGLVPTADVGDMNVVGKAVSSGVRHKSSIPFDEAWQEMGSSSLGSALINRVGMSGSNIFQSLMYPSPLVSLFSKVVNDCSISLDKALFGALDAFLPAANVSATLYNGVKSADKAKWLHQIQSKGASSYLVAIGKLLEKLRNAAASGIAADQYFIFASPDKYAAIVQEIFAKPAQGYQIQPGNELYGLKQMFSTVGLSVEYHIENIPIYRWAHDNAKDRIFILSWRQLGVVLSEGNGCAFIPEHLGGYVYQDSVKKQLNIAMRFALAICPLSRQSMGTIIA